VDQGELLNLIEDYKQVYPTSTTLAGRVACRFWRMSIGPKSNWRPEEAFPTNKHEPSEIDVAWSRYAAMPAQACGLRYAKRKT
jgi:hypothetical protein